MASDGTSYQIDIPVNAADVEAASTNVDALVRGLEQAKAATVAAADAVKVASAAYAQAEATADRAAKAVEKIDVAIAAQTQKIAEAVAADGLFADSTQRAVDKLEKLRAKQAEAVSAAELAKKTLADQAAALDQVKNAATQAADKEKYLGKVEAEVKKGLDATKKAADAAAGSGKINEIAEGFGKLGGPLGQLGQKGFGAAEGVKKLVGSLGAAGPYVAIAVAIAAIVASVVALTAAAVAGTAQIAAWSVSLADAARTNQLLADGIAGSVEGGAKLNATFNELEKSVPIARDELASMAKELVKSGKKGDELTSALTDAAEKAAEIKFGPEFRKEMLALPRQAEKFKKNVSGLFGGLKIDGLLKGLSSLVDLFDESNASGRAIKTVFESIFQPLIDGVTGFIPKMRSAFIEFEILALKALIAIKPWASTILLVGKAFAILAGIVVGVLAVALALFLAPLVIIIGLLTGAIALAIKFGGVLMDVASVIIKGPVAALDYLIQKFTDFVGTLQGMSLAEIGTALVQGLASGITGAASSVVDSLKGVVDGAVNSAKQALGIASPSKVFAEIGMQTGEGMQQGVEDSSAGVSNSLESLVAPPDAAPGAPAAASSTSDGASIAGNTFIFNGVKDAENARDLFLQAIEELTAKAGGMVPANG